ncbi:hypothetical protein [Roseivirga misakiensis]|uniref:Uncharacterized protein n=1 Tax=Roseivirga misakiensis TaxID=1563681 RepID=A0A1E5T4S6_9BACT|nr:hypothetical protein [Roseivirga misakiensis]OEK06385.1 hypothetical protein BFP71_01530 [Roseivirga misakiensis]
MKTTIYTLVLLVSLLSADLPIKQSQSESNKENIEVVFDRKMTFDDLAEIKADLKKKEVELSYSRLSFDDNGMLKAISFKVDCGDGFKGEARKSSLGYNDFGFFRNYDSGVRVPFGVGLINKIRD